MKKVIVLLLVVMMTVHNVKAQYLQWAKSMGGTSNDAGISLAVDPSGNIYTTGYFRGTVDFNPDTGVFNLTAISEDVFIQKLDADGNFLWAIRIGGSGIDGGGAISIGTSGNIYLSGYFWNTVDFNPGAGIFSLNSTGKEDIFILELDTSGNFIWAKRIGGMGRDMTTDMELDASNNIYLTGSYEGTVDFSPGPGNFYMTPVGGQDIFILKLDSSGNFQWAQSVGGRGFELSNSLAIDALANIYITGDFLDTADFDPGPDTLNLIPAGYDIFIQKFDSSGNYEWVKSIGGSEHDFGNSIAVDDSGNSYTTGSYYGLVDFDPDTGIYYLPDTGSTAFYILKLNNEGDFMFAKNITATGVVVGWEIMVDTSENVLIMGTYLGSADFDPGSGVSNLTSQNNNDIFIEKMDSSGNFLWAASLGGPLLDNGQKNALDAHGNIYVLGVFQGISDFDPGVDTFNLISAGNNDIFILKLSDSITLSGAILTETGIPIPGVTITISGDDTDSITTATDGKYRFEVGSGGTYIITPSKSNDSIPNNGITSLDVLLMRKYIVGIAPLSSPYKIIAAAEVSVDGDTTVNTQDVLLTRSLILGNISSFPTNRLWQFVSNDYVFPDNTHPFPFNKTRTYTNITTNQTNQNFIGIKLGDVNGSWDGNVH